jgi:hypothetical protein
MPQSSEHGDPQLRIDKEYRRHNVPQPFDQISLLPFAATFSPSAELRLNRRVDIACPAFLAIWIPTARKQAQSSHTRVAGM